MLIEEADYILILFFVFFSYQGSDLSASLLLFYEGEILTEQGK
jgi:hypothetical protein